MADSFTNNYDLVLQVTGSNSGTWGTDLNSNLISPLDTILGGTQSVVMSSANVPLSIAQWQNKAFKITGTLTANVQLILPLSPNAIGGTPGVGGEFIVDNQTTGAFTITVVTAATGSTGVVAPQGGRRLFYSDTVNVLYAESIITNASLASMPAWTLKGNPTGSGATPADFTIDSLTGKSPVAADEILIWDVAGTAMKKVTFGALPNSFAAPTVQRFTSGSGTYTPSAGALRIRVRMCAGGGGGGAEVVNNGAVGSNTTFGGWGCGGGGGGGAAGGTGGGGGSGGTNGTGTLVARFTGGGGQAGVVNNDISVGPGGGAGGNNSFGGGAVGVGNSTTGGTAAANTGGGGGGAGGSGNVSSGGGGGSGEYVEFWMTAAQIGASQGYTVGGGGNGGAAGGIAGGNGAAGIIIVEEFYI
jgi:hypothetical protein